MAPPHLTQSRKGAKLKKGSLVSPTEATYNEAFPDANPHDYANFDPVKYGKYTPTNDNLDDEANHIDLSEYVPVDNNNTTTNTTLSAMAEPRARPRQTGTRTFSDESLSSILYAAGANPPHLPETLRVFDEMITDFIIEVCHQAALCASYSRRQKIKADDFKFALRKDKELLGRVLEQLQREKGLKEDRKMLDVDGLAGGGGAAGGMEGLGELVGEEGKGGGRKGMKGKGAGKKRKVVETTAEDAEWEELDDAGDFESVMGTSVPGGNKRARGPA